MGTESIWCIKEDQAIALSFDLADSPSLPLPPPVSKLCLFFSVCLCVASRDCWREKGGGGEETEPNTTTRKPGPL